MEKSKYISKYDSNYIKRVIDKGYINDFDIIEVMKMEYVEFLNAFDNEKQKTNRALFLIYLNPTLLYKIDNLSDDLTNTLIDFVIYKYNLEKEELEYRYQNGEISKKEYDEDILFSENFYFPCDDVVGKNIRRIMEKRNKLLQKK